MRIASWRWSECASYRPPAGANKDPLEKRVRGATPHTEEGMVRDTAYRRRKRCVRALIAQHWAHVCVARRVCCADLCSVVVAGAARGSPGIICPLGCTNTSRYWGNPVLRARRCTLMLNRMDCELDASACAKKLCSLGASTRAELPAVTMAARVAQHAPILYKPMMHTWRHTSVLCRVALGGGSYTCTTNTGQCG